MFFPSMFFAVCFLFEMTGVSRAFVKWEIINSLPGLIDYP